MQAKHRLVHYRGRKNHKAYASLRAAARASEKNAHSALIYSTRFSHVLRGSEPGTARSWERYPTRGTCRVFSSTLVTADNWTATIIIVNNHCPAAASRKKIDAIEITMGLLLLLALIAGF